MVKAALVTPAYLSVAWALMVSYQIFTQTAVQTVVNSLTLYMPSLGTWLNFRIDMVVFIYAFAWVFVLSSIIPSLILGKERSVLVQFIVCLGLTLIGFIFIDLLKNYGFDLSDPAVLLANPYMGMFSNLIFAAIYLSLPYIIMLGIDLRSRKKRKENQRLQQATVDYFNKKPAATDKTEL